MLPSKRQEISSSAFLARGARLLLIAALALFVLRTAFKALNATFRNDDFPEALAIKVELLPVIFPVHMFTGGLALLLVPAMILLRNRPDFHRPLGRLSAVVILAAGLTAIPVAWLEPVHPVSAAGFIAQACVWMTLLGFGLWHIRHGNLDAHRACMLLMAATTSGAVFFRIYLALWAIFGEMRHFTAFYAVDSWIAWLLPLSLTAYFLKRTGENRAYPE